MIGKHDNLNPRGLGAREHLGASALRMRSVFGVHVHDGAIVGVDAKPGKRLPLLRELEARLVDRFEMRGLEALDGCKFTSGAGRVGKQRHDRKRRKRPGGTHRYSVPRIDAFEHRLHHSEPAACIISSSRSRRVKDSSEVMETAGERVSPLQDGLTCKMRATLASSGSASMS